ncbi:helix-turn-helix transcriptional regulator [Diaminobutyricibacter tongyongensis]|uniref:Helix-turn-helix transcriptional regulator n=1 Tax=Leifsonia tongyongensis TaxID=1268043 RepID=A0A6L9Y1U6_9MICO|nr:helix-turn-helix transcriptional regulator [Diaminobutyricibacter tongyongensis]NEN07640.1 helix-turn-helix transcriptional regulator [Diaminobutyricibacter tongyongensis]
MTDFRSETTLGSRIKLARRQRGFRTTREFADAIEGGNVTAAVLENVESGRKADISVSQLLNIAKALGVPPSMLLAPIGRPNARLDLPNLSDDFDTMTAAEFDCWLSATPASSYRPTLAAERVDVDILNTLRELGTLRREVERLRIVLAVQSASGDPDLVGANTEVEQRVEALTREVARVSSLLATSGLEDVKLERTVAQV